MARCYGRAQPWFGGWHGMAGANKYSTPHHYDATSHGILQAKPILAHSRGARLPKPAFAARLPTCLEGDCNQIGMPTSTQPLGQTQVRAGSLSIHIIGTCLRGWNVH